MKRFTLAALLAASLGFPAAAQDAVDIGGEEPVLNIYSSRHYQTDEALYEDFTEATGITINRLEGGGDELIERLINEGMQSPADLFITVDAGRLWRAETSGLFQSAGESQILEDRIPEHFRHPEGYWFGVSARARVLFYNKELIDPENLTTYEDLADPRWDGQVCIRSSSNIYNLSLMAAMIAHHGIDRAERWAEGVVANFARPPQGGDTDQLRAVASGECGIAVANTYYYARLVASDDPEDRAVADAVGIIFPNQDGYGAHVNISGAGVTAAAEHPQNARRFLEYLTSESAQRYFANGNNEYPVVEGTLDNPVLINLGEFKADTLNVSLLGQNQADAQRVFDRAGWR